MPFIPRIPSRVTRFIIPAVHSLPAPHIQPHYNGKHSTGTYTGFRRRISQHQQPLERPEIVRLPPPQEIEYADAAVRAVVHENVNEALAAGNNVHINEDGSKVYLYKQSDGKEVLVTVAVVGEGVAGVGTTVATGAVEKEYMTRTGLTTLASTEAVLLVVLSIMMIWLCYHHRCEKKKLQQKYISNDHPDEIPTDELRFAFVDDIEAATQAK
ncbi:hypothetical protein TWF102_005924 [Orbilia oligospora]|uniref:Uncharacterized protein n=1 Tax=Orbilia oligospora TaxID=2813651 RepID=A0A7C8N850_ORBOL|nr:hypothetical protein TWF706_011078 [Orbilia oligospora]KAF3098874.1 hypothetical protein TWF102_005924 [Orbilia oligospora]KAF3108139.1 hypothetical protein TWF103_005696 [Orbilia oligospora]KAF3130261.1 hypothetical protein TWF703_008249 [Orbilia oligospora]KAF3137453.1 hypothetical protein TWF594_007578 [Orbilia oligospora]